MSDEAKIHLSKYEREVVTNADLFLTKQVIIGKIYSFFGTMHEIYKSICITGNTLPKKYQIKNGKISKGENYLGLPYVILDYPATFERDNIFAIRTMFWWANFFSVTLHISGKEMMSKVNIPDFLSLIKEKDFLVCINEDEWQHNFERSNYISTNEMDEIQWDKVCKKSFIKISKKIDLIKWNEAPGFLEKSYRELIELVNVSFPGDEKAL